VPVGFDNTSAALAARNNGDEAGVERRAAASPAEQLAALDVLFSDEDFSAGFSKFVKDQQGNESRTYNEMNDNELMARLSEYLGSGVVNVSINNAEIETAQAVVAELYMSDEELAELDNAVSARAVQAKEKAKQEDRDRDFYQAEAERKLEEHRAQWDATMHKLGDKEYSGAELHAMHEWLKDEKNQTAYEDEIMQRDGVSREEAKRRRTEIQEYLALMEKQRNNEKLTAEEKLRLEVLRNKPTVQRDAAATDVQIKRGQNVELNSSNAAMRVGEESASVSAGSQNIIAASNTSTINDGKASWSYSAPPVKVEESLSPAYNVAAAGKVEPPKAPANGQALAQAVGISEPSPYG
jgi:hypothetical protein